MKNGQGHNLVSFGANLAEYVYKAFKSKLVRKAPPSLREWGRSFDELVVILVNREGSDRETIEAKVRLEVEDHVRNIDDEFQPQCLTARTICKRYEDIERAFRRHNRPNKSNRISDDQVI